MHKFDVAIVGGGAAGLACAVTLRQLNPRLCVAVTEAGARLGKKLAATGNGQGNVTNRDVSASHFHGSLAPFAARLVARYDVLSLFDCLFSADRAGKVYPAGKQASSLSDCLIKKLGADVQVFLNAKVTDISPSFRLSFADREGICADRVVLAAGGCAQKQFNTDGNAFGIAKSLGHTVTPLYPSLVQLRTDTSYTKTLKGIRAECDLRAYSSEGKLLASSSGDVIFTDYGVSGNAVFDISSRIADKTGVVLEISFLPWFSQEEVEEAVVKRRSLGYEYSELLCGSLHNQIGRAIMKRAQGRGAAEVARLVKHFTLPVCGSLGFDYAQVTKGGVPASEVGDDLQSRRTSGLYLAGEVLDLDGDCGGYNLTWAFASGMHVAHCIAGERA